MEENIPNQTNINKARTPFGGKFILVLSLIIAKIFSICVAALFVTSNGGGFAAGLLVIVLAWQNTSKAMGNLWAQNKVLDTFVLGALIILAFSISSLISNLIAIMFTNQTMLAHFISGGAFIITSLICIQLALLLMEDENASNTVMKE